MRYRSRRSRRDRYPDFRSPKVRPQGSRSLARPLSRPEPADRRGSQTGAARWQSLDLAALAVPDRARVHLRVLYHREDIAGAVAEPPEHERGAAQVHSLGVEEFRLA